MTKMRISSLTGATALCIFEQWCSPGKGAPMHWHEVEEVLSVVEGNMEVQLGDVQILLGPDESVIVPARVIHGFYNSGRSELHVQAILAASHFEAWRVGENESTVRWR
jgi:mannose-6-phosphate isomerase-like protein (cupin superfamily)